MGVGAGQGSASRGLLAPARYPRMRTDRGCGVSTESRALRYTVLIPPTYQRQQIGKANYSCVMTAIGLFKPQQSARLLGPDRVTHRP